MWHICGKNKRVVSILVWKHEVKILLTMRRRGLKDNIKIHLEKGIGERRMDFPGSGQRQGFGTCEHSNERSGFRTLCENILE